MKKNILLFTICLFGHFLFGQKAYFQQQTDYRINVVLDDEKHTLKGDISIEYTNNSSDDLTEIWMHLWANAYKNQRTRYAQQEVRNGSTKFYFSKANEAGFFTDIDFQVNNNKTTWNVDKKNPDIAVIRLASPLKAGEKLTITTPFLLKIPNSFSRLGHVEQSYQMTQWFPKPAVYDTKGWHAMPYLDMGEFFSEFGNFDVSITLPDNYVIGATGICEQQSEYDFLQQRTAATIAQAKKGFDKNLDYPASSKTTKTLRYKAENVHDFAWFADKRFWVLKETQALSDGKKVDCWAMFTNQEAALWKDGAAYVARAVKFYSDKVGNYPYPHATAVQSALSAGGGMEYPMITVIGKAGSAKSLDIVIAHEVGHNWFYGILATNERDHGWMDEGMNTYYEHLYTKAFYQTLAAKKRGLNLTEELMDAAFDWYAAQHIDQAPGTHSEDFLPINYGTCMYQKTGKSMDALAGFVGEGKFDEIMHSYFDAWKFKHPYPSDFRAHWEKNIGKNLSWFFDGLIDSNEKTAFTFKPIKNPNDPEYDLKFEVKNKGLRTPFPVSAMKDAKVILTKWYEMPDSQSNMTITFPKGEYDKIVLDKTHSLPQTNRNATIYAPSGKPLSNAPSVKLLKLTPDNERRINLGIVPAFNSNYYDGLMLGFSLYSPMTQQLTTQVIQVTPLFSFKSEALRGSLNVVQNFYKRKGRIARYGVNANIRSFAFDKNLDYDYVDYYNRAQIGADFDLRKTKLTDTKTSTFAIRYVNVKHFYHNNINFKDKIFRDTAARYGIAELKYTLRDEQTLSPSKLSFTLQAGKGFSKFFSHYQKKIQFERKREALYFNAFAGVFATSRATSAYVPFQTSGTTSISTFQRDYMYDYFLLARNTREPRYYHKPTGGKDTITTGNWRSQQIFVQDAGMRTLGVVGGNSDWMLGARLAYNLPLPLPIGIRPYFDAAVFPEEDSNGKKSVKTAWTAGIAAVIIPDALEIYFPIPTRNDEGFTTLGSNNLYFNKREKYTQRISFLFNINQLRLKELVKKVKMQ